MRSMVSHARASRIGEVRGAAERGAEVEGEASVVAEEFKDF